MNLDLGSLKIEPENIFLVRILEKDRLSLNIGGNMKIGILTLGYKTKVPIVVHSGLSKKWDSFFKLEKPGIFIGLEVRF